ncbi:hypothetical protein [Pseudoalteromonas gelatinilytica]|uniref:Uncharacterized protein n=1 Tax=Pseudoalteromonas gelatinilytica TaxID=1703256 RepID=A0ABQ1TJN7_9GAMM|nr:hypothetical protein [Pseudoalteromonas profundi]GGE96275.1 hypothetical protein GCM10008027_21650 [Pseudoalteromonas profundi]
MPTSKIDFHNAECSACRKKHVDIRTEIIAPSPDRPNAIRKKIIFRCDDHLDSDIDEIEKLALVKNRFQNLDEKALLMAKHFLINWTLNRYSCASQLWHQPKGSEA